VEQTTMGIGPALRRARELRGVRLEEASRDSKLSVNHLEALESEDFDPFGGEVFARAALGSYARYLGLDPEKVVGFYAHHADDPGPPPPPAKLGRVERALAAARIRDNQRFLLIAACLMIVVLTVFGLLSRDRVAPDASTIPTSDPAVQPDEGTVEVVLVALRPVSVKSSVDGGPSERFRMQLDETRALIGSNSVEVTVADGTAVRLTVNGDDLGIPGVPGPWKHRFTFVQEGVAPPGDAG
jgi:cytoskeleton protein RodZ